MFQSALRFAVVSYVYLQWESCLVSVSIRLEVRGGFIPAIPPAKRTREDWKFQSALRFAVVSDWTASWSFDFENEFQSALRFAVVSDVTFLVDDFVHLPFQSALRFAVVSDGRL